MGLERLLAILAPRRVTVLLPIALFASALAGQHNGGSSSGADLYRTARSACQVEADRTL